MKIKLELTSKQLLSIVQGTPSVELMEYMVQCANQQGHPMSMSPGSALQPVTLLDESLESENSLSES